MGIPRFKIDDLVKVTSVPRREHFPEPGRIVGRIAESDLPSRIVYAVEFPSGTPAQPFFGFELKLTPKRFNNPRC
jgi:hypothetical protein